MVDLWLFMIVVGFVISIMILHWIITSAINSSEIANDIKEIKQILKRLEASNDVKNITMQKLDDQSEGTFNEQCPACGEQVRLTDKICSGCGLTLMIDDERG